MDTIIFYIQEVYAALRYWVGLCTIVAIRLGCETMDRRRFSHASWNTRWNLIQRCNIRRMRANVFIQVIGHVNRRRSTLRAIHAFAGSATNTYFLKMLGSLQIDCIRINKFIRMTHFAAKANRKETIWHAKSAKETLADLPKYGAGFYLRCCGGGHPIR